MNAVALHPCQLLHTLRPRSLPFFRHCKLPEVSLLDLPRFEKSRTWAQSKSNLASPTDILSQGARGKDACCGGQRYVQSLGRSEVYHLLGNIIFFVFSDRFVAFKTRQTSYVDTLQLDLSANATLQASSSPSL